MNEEAYLKVYRVVEFTLNKNLKIINNIKFVENALHDVQSTF